MAGALNPRNEGSTPPQRASTKNAHSPWSAQRERKRRSKPVAAGLAQVNEAELEFSPPKRHHGGSGSAAARDVVLERPLGSPFYTAEGPPAAAAAGGDAGPLAQGLFALASDAGYSPLAAGLPAFASGASFCQSWQASALGADKQQRRHVRPASRAAAGRQRGAADAVAGGAVAAGAAPGSGGSAAPCHPPPGSVFDSVHWQPALVAAAAGAQQPFSLPPMAPAPAAAGQQQQQQQPAQQQQEQHMLAPASRQQQQEQAADGGRPSSAQRGAARCSTGGQEMETDASVQQLRGSWSSDRSADVTPWQSLQARLREGAAGDAAECRRQASLASEGGASDAHMRGSAEGLGLAPSGRSSLDGPAERQTSQLPLRAAARGAAWPSHLASPPEAGGLGGATPDALLAGQGRSSSGRKQRSGGTWGACFSCASPFSCRQRPSTAGGAGAGSDGEGEVVRRNSDPRGGEVEEEEEEEEEFVIRRQPSYATLVGGSPGDASPARGSAGRPKHTSLNRPPSGEDLVGRQHAFSARCTPPGAPWSPCSDDASGSDDSFSLPSRGPPHLRSVGLRDASLDELAGGAPGGKDGGEGGGAPGPAPTVDALNDMLKALSLCPTSHPKDAEALVARACTEGIQPNATTARTLEKLWAVHEQLYG